MPLEPRMSYVTDAHGLGSPACVQPDASRNEMLSTFAPVADVARDDESA